MATERRQLLLLALVIVLVTAVYAMWPATSTAPTAASKTQGAPGGGRSSETQPATPAAPDVHLESLDAERPKPGPPERDLFRFKAPKPAAAPPSSRPPPSAEPSAASAPEATGAQAAQVPPITLKFIGLMESPTQAQKIAVLSDGRGTPFYGREGEIVEGRYRILRIGVESIDIAYADGRGRQTIRLTGQ
jgi:hypothetical protein